MEWRGLTRTHEAFKDIYGMVNRGACFALVSQNTKCAIRGLADLFAFREKSWLRKRLPNRAYCRSYLRT